MTQTLALFNARGETRYKPYKRQEFREGEVVFPVCTHGHDAVTHIGIYEGNRIITMQNLSEKLTIAPGERPVINIKLVD